MIEKTTFSALIQGSSGLDAYLGERGIDTLIITDADHNAALCAVYSTFGDVMPTDMVVGLLTSTCRTQ